MSFFLLGPNFYVGAFDEALNEAAHIHANSLEEETTAEVYRRRIYLATGVYDKVVTDIPNNLDTEEASLQLCILYGKYKTASNPEDQKNIVSQMKVLISSDTNASPQVKAIGATLFMEEGDYKGALKLLSQSNDDMELLSLRVQALIKMDRTDLALQVVEEMNSIDEDSALAQLSTSWCNLAVGGK